MLLWFLSGIFEWLMFAPIKDSSFRSPSLPFAATSTKSSSLSSEIAWDIFAQDLQPFIPKGHSWDASDFQVTCVHDYEELEGVCWWCPQGWGRKWHWVYFFCRCHCQDGLEILLQKCWCSISWMIIELSKMERTRCTFPSPKCSVGCPVYNNLQPAGTSALWFRWVYRDESHFWFLSMTSCETSMLPT